uniref:mitogen-activated protein kinase kinase n=1 Tax=Acrobeloides nanus TaxID=290746 RepID=A0A914CLH0_9BILA
MDLHVIRQSNASPHIVRSLGYILTSQDLYICMELMTSCLERILKLVGQGLPEAIIGKITVSVLNGLNYLIESIMHRDVKPSNMLMDLQGNIKLCDFGIAGQLLEHLPPSVTLGCISYLAPERIERKPYDIRADVWSLGISLIYLAKFQFPYEQDTQFGMMLRILNNPAPTINPQDSKFSLEFCKFVERCLQKDMEKRATYSVLFTLPFYVKSDEEKVDVAEWCHKYINK